MLCSRGSYDTHYDETSSPVVRFATIRTIVALATIMNWPIFQLDVNSAYLYGKMDREVHMHIPDGWYPDAKKGGKVLRLLA